VVLALGALLAGRQVRHQLLVGPDGAWRRELWLDAVLATPDGDPAEGAAPGTGPMGAAGTPGTAGTGAAAPGATDEGPKTAAAGPGSASPSRGRAGSRPARATLTTPLEINLCSPDSLQLLPGVGPVLAARIEEARRQGTIFRKPSDLLEIKGIGPAAMARLTPLVRFAAPAPPGPASHNPH
jgi:competence protein ComEA